MSSTGKSNTEVIAEAVSAIGPWQAWIAAKRVEVQGQIAQMQTASGAPATGTHDSPLTARLRSVVFPGTSTLPTATGAPDTDTTTDTANSTLPHADLHSTLVEGGDPNAADTSQATRSAGSGAAREEPVTGSPAGDTTSTTPTPGRAPQTPKEAQAHLEAVFAATPPHTLPPVVVAAWAERGHHSLQCAKVLVAAQDAGLLPDALAQAVTHMIGYDKQFAAVLNAYGLNLYPDLVGIFPAPAHGPDEDAEEDAGGDGGERDEDDADAAEGEGDENEGEAEAEKQWGFPGEDSLESPF